MDYRNIYMAFMWVSLLIGEGGWIIGTHMWN